MHYTAQSWVSCQGEAGMWMDGHWRNRRTRSDLHCVQNFSELTTHIATQEYAVTSDEALALDDLPQNNNTIVAVGRSANMPN